MKNVCFTYILICFLSSCDISFDMEAVEKEIPVIYGVIEYNQAKQYIRIERVFQSKGKNIDELAKNPNVLYFESGKATLYHPKTGKVIVGKKIDGDKIGLNRVEGPFLQSPNILYEFETANWKIDPPTKIIFSFESPTLEKPATCEIPIITDLQLRESAPAAPLNLGYDRLISIGWINDTEAKVFDIVMSIHYLEKNSQTNGMFVPKTLDWVLKKNLEAGPDPTKGIFSFKGVEFYKFLNSSLTSASDKQRIIESVHIELTAGGVAFREILNINQANFGITGSTNLPKYNPITNGIGFLSSRLRVQRSDISLASTSLDSLRNGIYTKSLQFR